MKRTRTPFNVFGAKISGHYKYYDTQTLKDSLEKVADEHGVYYFITADDFQIFVPNYRPKASKEIKEWFDRGFPNPMSHIEPSRVII